MRLIAMLAVVTLAAAFGGVPEDAPARAQTAAPTARTAGTLRGRVDLQRAIDVAGRRPAVADLASPPAAAGSDLKPVVVFLESPDVPAGSELRSARTVRPVRARMDQRNETFSPSVLAVNVGSTVDFPNNDSTFHNVFSLSKTRRFDLGRYGRGESEAVRFDRPGVVRVFCDIHSHMSAFVLVFNHPYHATVGADGRYQIDQIPPGTYTVVAWQEGDARDTRTVTIPATGAPTDLDLLVR